MSIPKSPGPPGSSFHPGHRPESAGVPVVLPAVGASGAIPSADSLEVVCIELIDRLRQLRTEATQWRDRGRYGRAAAVGQRMLLALLDFAEAQLSAQPLQGIQERIADAYEQIRRIDSLAGSAKASFVQRALGKRLEPSAELLEAHAGLGESIAVAVIMAIAGGEDRFQPGSESAKQMADRLKMLVGELRTQW